MNFLHGNMKKMTFKLKMFVMNDRVRELYKDRIESSNPEDSGFDLLTPYAYDFEKVRVAERLLSLGMGVKCAMFKDEKPTGFYLYPRSSLSKTALRMSNSVGIIDSGYRGELIAMVDILSDLENQESAISTICPYTRLFQICAPGLEHFDVELVDSVEELGMTTRGSGGFGSTGV